MSTDNQMNMDRSLRHIILKHFLFLEALASYVPVRVRRIWSWTRSDTSLD